MSDTLQLLEDFAAKVGDGSRYSGDARKIDVLLEYFWLRSLMPQPLPFDEFLAQYARVADHDEQNLKHPATATARFCPRAADKAKQYNLPQWSAKQLKTFLGMWVDALEECRRAGETEPPLTFAQFLQAMGSRFLNGEFDPPKEAKPRKKKTDASTGLPGQQSLPFASPGEATPLAGTPPALPTLPQTTASPTTTVPPAVIGGHTPVVAGQSAAMTDAELAAMSVPAVPGDLRPTGPGQRVCVTTGPGSHARHHLGVTQKVETDAQTGRQYADVRLDDGTLITGKAIADVRLLPGTATPVERPADFAVTLVMPEPKRSQWSHLLTLNAPIANTGFGVGDQSILDAAIELQIPNCNKKFQLLLCNSEQGPRLEVALLDVGSCDELLATKPRNTLLGDYFLDYENQRYKLTIQ